MDRLLRASQTGASKANHTEDPMTLLDHTTIIDLEKAKYEGGYKLRLLFSDGMARTVDFEPFLKRSLNPMIRKYLQLDLFKAFTVENGDLQWNDYDLCFPIADLYAGDIR